MRQPLISVIVPCYNVERYICECLRSLRDAGKGRAEIICVDDMSADYTVDLIKDMMSKDRQIKLVRHQFEKNIYGGACRNVGLEKASGDFVYFCDSDDYVLPRLFDECLKTCDALDPDICCFRHIRKNTKTGETDSKYRGIDPEMIFGEKPGIYNYTCVQNVFTASGTETWDKFYKRSFLNENRIRFQETRNSNDNLFHVKTMSLAKKIAPIDKAMYVYRTGTETSVQADFANGNNQLDFVEAMNRSLDYIESTGSARLKTQFTGWALKKADYVTNCCRVLTKEFLQEYLKFVNRLEYSNRRLFSAALNKMENLVKA